jgi:serine/threonine protein kinase
MARYQTMQKIGEGMYGVVYKALDRMTNQVRARNARRLACARRAHARRAACAAADPRASARATPRPTASLCVRPPCCSTWRSSA